MTQFQNQKGQAMVEAAGALWILFLMFVCVYYLFLMSIDKIRSLDTAYHLARAQEVEKMSRWPNIDHGCFGRLGWGVPQVNHMRIAGLGVDEVTFRFMPRTFQALARPWTSAMRVAMPDSAYLGHSWPGAPQDPPASLAVLTGEAALVRIRVQSNSDAAWDTRDTATDTLDAERG